MWEKLRSTACNIKWINAHMLMKSERPNRSVSIQRNHWAPAHIRQYVCPSTTSFSWHISCGIHQLTHRLFRHWLPPFLLAAVASTTAAITIHFHMVYYFLLIWPVHKYDVDKMPHHKKKKKQQAFVWQGGHKPYASLFQVLCCPTQCTHTFTHW